MPAFDVHIVQSGQHSAVRLTEPPGYILANVPAATRHNRRFSSPEANDLPTYEEAVDGSSPPPSYSSIFGKVQEAHRRSVAFKNILALLLGTIGCSFVVGVIVFIPISMIFFGAIYMNECPVSKYIPVYLLIGGIMGILKPLLTLSLYVRTSEEDQAEERLRQVGTQSMLNWFIFGWFLIGSYWIYREYEPNYNPSKGLYCNHTLYTFAFWLITSAYIICVTFVMILILLTIISVIINVKTVNSAEATNI